MNELPTLVRNWLYSVIKPRYINIQVVYTHLYQFLQRHLGRNLNFKIRTSVYTSAESGHSDLLINLYGNIETHNGLSLPIKIWIPFNYPYKPSHLHSDDIGVPMVYISLEKSSKMLVRSGNHFDTQGRFYHPYLADWHLKYPYDSNKYNLLDLLSIVNQTVERENPVYFAEAPTRVDAVPSNLPPKPAKIPLVNSESVPIEGSLKVDNDVLPKKPLKIKINKDSTGDDVRLLSAREVEKRPQGDVRSTDTKITGSLNTQRNYDSTNTHVMSNVVGFSECINEPKDILDFHEQPGEGSASKDMENSMKEALKNDVYYLLRDDFENGLNFLMPFIRENNLKVATLLSQLRHHNEKAKGNETNLNSHLLYLKHQVSLSHELNKDLVSLDRINSSNRREILVNSRTAFDLDNFVLTDSALVGHLYDVVSDIKATRDTIDLISGNYKNGSEMVQNSNMESCVRAVRGYGRELFWLEVMKYEIGVYMGLNM